MITCNDYDFIEIACLYQFSVEVTLKDGVTYRGTAIDTHYDDARRQCLVLTGVADAGSVQRVAIPLSELRSMRALTKNPHFDEVGFTSNV